jgi:hypothetical protein
MQAAKIRRFAYNADMLDDDEKATLEHFIANTEKGTAYRRRAQILVMYSEGIPPETSAPQLDVSIVQARALLRAFKRQRMAIFPADLFAEEEKDSS